MKSKVVASFTHRLFRYTTGVSLLLLAALHAAATISTSLQMQLGNPSSATTNAAVTNNYLIQRTVESIGYSAHYNEPIWASWDLTTADVGGSGRNSSFYTDTNLPATFYWVKTGDYTGSGFDRGHLCPSADRTDTTNINKLVFYMSNIMPQTPDNNQGIWANFEDDCRTFASAGNELIIMCGPSTFSGARINTNGPVYIPGYTWKVAVIVPTGSGTALSRLTATNRVIAINVPNIAGIRTTPWTNFVTSVNALQTTTGFTFFTAVASDIAEVLRARVDGAAAPGISGFSPSSAATNASVTITGNNFSGASIVKFNTTYATSFTVNSGTQITATVPAGATSGAISVIAPGGLAASAGSFTVTNGTGGGGGGTTNLTVSQVYGGGGNSGATYINDFIEIYNAGTATVNLSTYAVQYASSTGSSWSETILNGTIAPGAHYLIQEAAGTGGTTALPTPQAIGTISMSATAGKVALTKTTTLLTVSNPVGTANVVDFVGYGSANAYEGTGPAPTISATASDSRAGGGATDTNDNQADFTAGTVNPRNN
ncbi:MAG TPA: DNA/RNA non-specific endonuclease [Verrucomicrobiae bacterium]|nr:DNA/RNA non-specific endonuclease [Verrucomicrobiae bacterium]